MLKSLQIKQGRIELNGKENTHESLKLYKFHGLDLQINGKEAIGDCPFCGKEEKFSVNVETQKWGCFVCDSRGNQFTFLRRLYDQSKEYLEEKHEEEIRKIYENLVKDRGISKETLEKWGVVKNFLNDKWIFPAFNSKKKIVQLYKYVKIKGKHRLLATPTLSHGIFGVNLDREKSSIFICEGPWDGMKLWEELRTTREHEEMTVSCKPGSKEALSKEFDVVSVPGCNTFSVGWKQTFKGRNVIVAFDNDYPRKHPKTGKVTEPASVSGTKRICGILTDVAENLGHIRWGEDGYTKELDNGTDIRDVLKKKSDLKFLLEKIRVCPEDWQVSENEQKRKQKDVQPQQCEKWIKLTNCWKKAMRWSEGLDSSLSVMLASIVSTDLVGDQLWVKIIGPASCGKSTLCEAVSVSKEYVLAKSTIRGFHSGFKEGKKKTEDNSLLVQVASKTLVTKDGDTLLQAPNLGQILSEARDIYDKTSRTHYRNNMGKDYTGVNMTWILCGTSSLRSIDSSELGERFLDCVIMEEIDDDMENEILMRVAKRENKNLGEVDADETKGHDPNMKKAMELTGGYIEYLRKNADDLMSTVDMDDRQLIRITKLAKFVSYMRARPSQLQTELCERELAARLTSQHLRLAKCLAVVLNKKSVEKECMKRTRKVSLDTARGIVLDICRVCYENKDDGVDVRYVAMECNQKDDVIRKTVRFLKGIGVLEQFTKKTGRKSKLNAKRVWRMTPKLTKLYEEIVLDW